MTKILNLQLTTLDPRPFTLNHPLTIIVEGDEDLGWVAAFYEASIAGSGETVFDAIEDLKDGIVGALNHVSRLPSELVGSFPRKQLAVLKAVTVRKEP